MRGIAAGVFLLASILFGLLFLWQFATGLTLGDPLHYAVIVLLGIGCAGCLVAFRTMRQRQPA